MKNHQQQIRHSVSHTEFLEAYKLAELQRSFQNETVVPNDLSRFVYSGTTIQNKKNYKNKISVTKVKIVKKIFFFGIQPNTKNVVGKYYEGDFEFIECERKKKNYRKIQRLRKQISNNSNHVYVVLTDNTSHSATEALKLNDYSKYENVHVLNNSSVSQIQTTLNLYTQTKDCI